MVKNSLVFLNGLANMVKAYFSGVNMTDEKLAEEFANNGYALGCTVPRFEVAKKAFLAGRQSNNKQITDLEEINADLKQSLDWANQRENENVNLIIKMRSLLKEVYNEFGFSELVKIRNNLPAEIKELIED